MKTTPLISLGLSVVLGAGAILLGRYYMSDARTRAEAQTGAPVVSMAGVMVAARTIETGEQLDASMLKRVEWPENIIPEGTLSEPEALPEKAYSRGLIIEGEPVNVSKLDMSGATLTLAGSIKPGMRAVSIVVRSDTGVSGFVLPGDRVDVNEFISREGRGSSYARGDEDMRISGDLIARPVLKNVSVLAVDQTFEPNLEGAMPSNTVTLEVTPEGSLALGAASQRGALGLALIGRDEEAELVVATRKEVKKPAVVRTAVRRRSPFTTQVRVINGNQETEVSAPVSPGNPPKKVTD
ncbi:MULTISPECIES: Flp pilus assembly protein CpaB [Hyphomonas]|uniref:Flp pilus assembly protein CpaB n=1 Tax=Hyphomonas adhaerens TaxID=81029 RepID=A0A3B9GZM7_9PROT|nr:MULTISPECIES: Flp pilus assembly protein CpaB [Hyphomonas]MBB41741.1 Flp pilus assembly protein CpaB [Hyphomonas sp.]HAE27897.1 Flp pilus assembly protein CpaB [Hyphomonas adhaerens]|tara:strand:+ start:552 stop:1439 length:888 start_codon:yes stop_codon:yes gene_type:complete